MAGKDEGFKLHSGVLELIAGMALLGLKGGSSPGGRSEAGESRPRRKNLIRGIKASREGDEVRFNLDLVVDYGQDAVEVARGAQELVRESVEGMTGFRVSAVDVNVVGLHTP